MSDPQTHRNNLQILGLIIALGLALIGIISGYWSFTMSGTQTTMLWWGNWLQDVGTEMLGAAITILLVELVISRKRDEVSRIDQERDRRREHFIEQLKRSRSQEKRQKILTRMEHHDLLEQAWLCGLDLSNSNLAGYSLIDADLFEANLANSSLQEADFTDAVLRRANLSCADLTAANLTEADLTESNLSGADLFKATLRKVDLTYTKFSSTTRLPDGAFWTPDLDLEPYLKGED